MIIFLVKTSLAWIKLFKKYILFVIFCWNDFAFNDFLDNFHETMFGMDKIICRRIGCLTILTGKNYFSQFSKKNFEIEAWLLLIFFICLHSQLSSIHSIVPY